jgi:hypothetical protein
VAQASERQEEQAQPLELPAPWAAAAAGQVAAEPQVVPPQEARPGEQRLGERVPAEA